MMRILHLSDTHFGTERPRVMDALCRLSAEQKPDIAVLSGDITQRARQSQFAAARRFLDELKIPQVFTLPGNHDIPLFNPVARLFHPYQNFCRTFGPTLEPVFENDSLLLICVNTTRAYRHKNGEISSLQLDQVAARLHLARRQQLRIVVTHQPLYVIGRQDEHNRARGYQQAVQAWSAAGADLVLGGHIHLPFCCRIELQEVALPRSMWAVQAGTAVSWRVRGNISNSVNIVCYSPKEKPPRCEVQRWDYVAFHGRFEIAEVTRCELTRD